MHLRTIESALQVSIAHRHEQLKVDGPKARATQALELLQALYEMAGWPIREEQLQPMLAGDSAMEEAEDDAIVLTRPAVEAGERLGFLPGDLTQKVAPYLRPLYDALYDLMGFDRVQKVFAIPGSGSAAHATYLMA